MKCPLQRRALPCGLILFFLLVGNLLAAERLTVGQLQKYHASYQLHSVTLIGRVQGMHVFPPVQTFKSKRCSPLYRVAQFELVDDTGTIQAEILESCFAVATKLPEDGDVIELTATIQVFSPDGRTERVIKAITQDIIVLKSAAQDPQSP